MELKARLKPITLTKLRKGLFRRLRSTNLSVIAIKNNKALAIIPPII
jgi:hypothetical protein